LAKVHPGSSKPSRKTRPSRMPWQRSE
jgi:hypothetical protein